MPAIYTLYKENVRHSLNKMNFQKKKKKKNFYITPVSWNSVKLNSVLS